MAGYAHASSVLCVNGLMFLLLLPVRWSTEINPEKAAAFILFAALFAVAGVFFSLYLVFSPVGSQMVWCFQSRYLIPPAVAASIGLPCLFRSERGYRLAMADCGALSTADILLSSAAIFDRYYLMTEQPNYIAERLYFADALESQGKLDEAVQEYLQLLAVMPVYTMCITV